MKMKMKKDQVIKREYTKPKIEIIGVVVENHLLEASVSGGHHSADDDETLNAKKTGIFDEEDFSPTDESAWKN